MSKEVKKTCFIYARTSSDKNDDKISCELQIQNCTKYAKDKNILIKGIFRDDDRHGWTYWEDGLEEKFDDQAVIKALKRAVKKRRSRKELGELLSRLDDVDIVLSNDPSRLMRVKLHSSLAQNLFNLINTHKNELHFYDRGYLDHNNAQTTSMFLFEQGMRQASKEEELKRAIDTLRENRVTGKKFRNVRCYGIKNSRKKHKIKPVPKELEIVARVFRLFVDENYSRAQIAREFNEQGVKTIKGGSWDWTKVNGILINPRYIGKIWKYSLYDAEELGSNKLIDSKLFWPVKKNLQKHFDFSEELFDRASNKIKSQKVDRSGHKSHKNPLPKKLKCGACGRYLRINHYNRPNQKGSVYFCGGNKYSKPAKTPLCLGSTIAVKDTYNDGKRVGLLEALKPLCLINFFEEYKNSLREPENKKSLYKLQSTRDELSMKFDSILDDIEEAKQGSMRKERLNERADKYEVKINELDFEILSLSKKINISQLSFHEFIQFMNDENKFIEILNLLISEIVVFQDKIVVKLAEEKKVIIPRYQYENFWYLPNPTTEILNLKYKGITHSMSIDEFYELQNIEGYEVIFEYFKVPASEIKVSVSYIYPLSRCKKTGRAFYPWGERLKPKSFTRKRQIYDDGLVKIEMINQNYENITFNSKKYNIYQFAKEFNIPLKTVQWRLKKGWSLKKVIETPVKSLSRKRLCIDEVEEIRELCANSSMMVKDIASKFGVHRDTISRIKNKHAHLK